MKSYVRSRLCGGLALLATLGLIPSATPAFASDTRYQTVMWSQVDESGRIAFRLNEEAVVYYRCDTARASLCQAILLTAISTGREVRVFYSDGGGHNPDHGDTLDVESLRIR